MKNITYKEIKFSKTMGADKRNPNLAYLKVNNFDAKTDGFYPAKGLDSDIFSSEWELKGLFSTNHETPFYVIYNKNTDKSYWDWYTDHTPDNLIVDGEEVLSWSDGNYGMRFGTDDGKIYDGAGVLKGDTGSHHDIYITLHDGLHYYYFSKNGKIYRQIDDEPLVEVFDGIPDNVKTAFTYNDTIILVSNFGNRNFIYFWDKEDNTKFIKRISLYNTYISAIGVLEGKLMMLHNILRATNKKEHETEIRLSQYNGENFTMVNSILLPNGQTRFFNKNLYSVGNSIMIAYIKPYDRDKPTKGRRFIIKATAEGYIEMLHDVTFKDDTSTNIISGVFVGPDANFVWGWNKPQGGSTYYATLWNDRSHNNEIDEFGGLWKAEYITNLLESSIEQKSLKSLVIFFEQLFDDTQGKLTIYYRLSDRENDESKDYWKELAVIDINSIKENGLVNRDETLTNTEIADNDLGLGIQTYEINTLPDGSQLPDFNEIQYKFVSEKGFSIIKAYHGFDKERRSLTV